MKPALLLAACLLATHSASQASEHTDPAHMSTHGAMLHDKHCVKCHGDEVYLRDDRRIKSLPALGTQVRRCRDNLGMQWFDEDTNAVVEYLNQRYYKF